MKKLPAMAAYGECVTVNGRELGPDEYTIDRATGVITLKAPAPGGSVLEFGASLKQVGRPRRVAQWKREIKGVGA
jgi:hypothetical protein